MKNKIKDDCFPNATNVLCCIIDCPMYIHASYPVLFTVYNNNTLPIDFATAATGVAASFDYMYCLYISDSIY